MSDQLFGSIKIDGFDASEVDLQKWRNVLTIIPQVKICIMACFLLAQYPHEISWLDYLLCFAAIQKKTLPNYKFGMHICSGIVLFCVALCNKNRIF